MLGIVPSGYAVASKFEDVISQLEKAKTSSAATTDTEKNEGRLKWVTEARQSLIDRFHSCSGWLIFFYTSSAHGIVSMRFRESYTRRFNSFKPGKQGGVFGRELFTPYQSKELKSLNDMALILEGEFNVLQLQSLATRLDLGYVNAFACGSVNTADFDTIKRVAAKPVICYDHDENGAGRALVDLAKQHMTVLTCTTPAVDSDLDSFIREFKDDVDAWRAVQKIVASREVEFRIYSGSGDEFFKHRTFVPKWLGDAIMEQRFFRFAAQTLYVYEHGVYVPKGELVVRQLAQEWLGDRRK
jgi:hypothetical protein